METPTRHAIIETAIGEMIVVAAGEALVGVYFPGHWRKPTLAFGPRVAAGSDALLAAAERQLTDYAAGQRTTFDLPTATRGDAFQERIWALLREIPFGATVTYGDLADRFGDRRLAREVGQAVGGNPLSVIVPCHRVIGKDGALVGYAGGLERKQALLALEGSLPVAIAAPAARNLTLW